MITCTRRLQWCSGHRVYQHEGKCAHLHGHNYVGYFTAMAPELDEVGRVIDFSVLKSEIGDWIDEHWDHGFIFFEDDAELFNLFKGPMNAMKHYKAGFNPTAENMAHHLLKEICPAVLFSEQTGVIVTKVNLWETENCYAVAEFDLTKVHNVIEYPESKDTL